MAQRVQWAVWLRVRREARGDREEHARAADQTGVGLQQRAARPPVRADPALVEPGRERARARHARLEQRDAQAAREAPRAHPPSRRGRQGGQDGAEGSLSLSLSLSFFLSFSHSLMGYEIPTSRATPFIPSSHTFAGDTLHFGHLL